MNILSLFDGISCAHLALDRLGITVDNYYASEIDDYARAVVSKRYPGTIQLGDVSRVAGVKDIDLLIGGSPCQDLSIAKKGRKGLSGPRSGLFWEYVRIWKETKPKWFVLENVASMPKKDKDIITETMGVEPIMINAALVSAQNRKRLFRTNIPVEGLPEDKGILLQDILEGGEVDRDKSYCIDACYYKGASWEQYKKKGRRQLVRVGQFGKGGQGDRIYSPEGKSVALSANGGGRGAKTGLYAVPVALRNRGEGKKPEYNKTGKANALTTVQTDSMVEEYIRSGELKKDFPRVGVALEGAEKAFIARETVIRKLTPIERERLQGVPDNYTLVPHPKLKREMSNTQRYKMLGNAFNVDVVAFILSFINKDLTSKE